ncbi:uncharacterized protein NPIL_229471 [Nephila pilipes]|uniref:Uncharacterized protein n=1 Tax=Nephila pilipes TaxID=299642 RepID=A0A8X6UDI3_NEPPI|nr:uncharacterized protein NPIL_229471 [Nephila pilipes]
MEYESDNVNALLHEDYDGALTFSPEKNSAGMNFEGKSTQNDVKKDSSTIINSSLSLESFEYKNNKQSNDTTLENVMEKNNYFGNEMFSNSENNSIGCIYQIKNENCNFAASNLIKNESDTNVIHGTEIKISNELENASSLEKDFHETSKVENHNLKIQDKFQFKLNLDNISNSGINNSSNDCNSSGIENAFDENMENIDSKDYKINKSKSEDALSDEFHNKEFYDVTETKMDGNLKIFGEKSININITEAENHLFEKERNSAHSLDSIKFPYRNSSNPFEIVVPLIGKTVIASSDIKPFNHRYDLAKERNKLKGLQEASCIPKLSYHDWRKQRDARPQEEKDNDEKQEKLVAIQTGAYTIKIAMNILQELQKDDCDEEVIEKQFLKFLHVPVSTLSLLLVPQFIHIMMYIRSSTHFSLKLRQIANECYLKCHVMFPIPNGYNFETVYTSEVKKNLPAQFDTMHNIILDYGDFENPSSECGNSAFSDE